MLDSLLSERLKESSKLYQQMIFCIMKTDTGIDTLIDLNGNIVQQERGYWVEIHAWRVESTVLIPHGVRYALTLHEQNGKRVMGYDNAHSVKPSGRFKYAGQVSILFG